MWCLILHHTNHTTSAGMPSTMPAFEKCASTGHIPTVMKRAALIITEMTARAARIIVTRLETVLMTCEDSDVIKKIVRDHKDICLNVSIGTYATG